MLDLIKWFWTSIDFRNWTFEGQKLNNPIIIFWRLFWAIPCVIFKFLHCAAETIYSLDLDEFRTRW